MAKEVTIDFEGAPPAQGRQFSHIPPGTYLLGIKAELTDTSTGKRAVSVTLTVLKGAQKSRKVGDLFVIPRKNTDDSPFGIQRLNALLVASGIAAQKKKAKGSSIVKALTGRKIVAEVDDNEIPATDTRAATMTSRPTNFYKVGSKDATEALKLGGDSSSATKAAAEPEEEPEGEDVESDEGDEESADSEEEEGGEITEDDAGELFGDDNDED